MLSKVLTFLQERIFLNFMTILNHKVGILMVWVKMSTFIKNKTFSHKASILYHAPKKVESLRQWYNFINSYFHKVCNFKDEILLHYLIKFESWNLVVIKSFLDDGEHMCCWVHECSHALSWPKGLKGSRNPLGTQVWLGSLSILWT